MNHWITMPMFRVVAGAEGMYFAGRDALATAGGHDWLLHLMHPGFLLLCAYVVIETMQFTQAWMRGRKVATASTMDAPTPARTEPASPGPQPMPGKGHAARRAKAAAKRASAARRGR